VIDAIKPCLPFSADHPLPILAFKPVVPFGTVDLNDRVSPSGHLSALSVSSRGLLTVSPRLVFPSVRNTSNESAYTWFAAPHR
jgi:hypothetical protein